MTDRDVVERVGALLDRAVVHLGRRMPHHKPAYAVTVKGAPAAALMRRLRPGLSETRQRQVDRALLRTGPASAPEGPLLGCGERCDLAWLAGLLEGEGHFGLSHSRGSRYPVISVEMCDEAVVTRAAWVLGSGAVHRRERAQRQWRTTFVTTLSGALGAERMRHLRPLMGLRRTAAIDRALAAYRPIRLTEVPDGCTVEGCASAHRSRGLSTATT